MTGPRPILNKHICLDGSTALHGYLDLIRINGSLGANGSSLGREEIFPMSPWEEQFSKWCPE